MSCFTYSLFKPSTTLCLPAKSESIYLSPNPSHMRWILWSQKVNFILEYRHLSPGWPEYSPVDGTCTRTNVEVHQ